MDDDASRERRKKGRKELVAAFVVLTVPCFPSCVVAVVVVVTVVVLLLLFFLVVCVCVCVFSDLASTVLAGWPTKIRQ